MHCELLIQCYCVVLAAALDCPDVMLEIADAAFALTVSDSAHKYTYEAVLAPFLMQ